ncbi:succinyl-diaminopimelate desuccinylase, partial [Staphylococcus epidermidis]|nr:succinyl-diaminopimelate desuccinylase [Staphylococcus epidermidis]
TDASSFLGTNENNVDFAVFGPGESIMAHQVDEFIRKDMYLSYIDVYKDVFKAYLEK